MRNSQSIKGNKYRNRKKIKNSKNYLEIEQKFNNIAKSLNMPPAKLDLYMWFMKTGRVLK